MRWVAALLISTLLSGCGYHLVGLNTGASDPRLANRLALKIDDPFGRQARLIQEALKLQNLDGQGLNLEILEFSLDRRTLSELADRDEFELRATLTFGVRQADEPYLLGPETLRRDGLLTLLDSNSDSLDSDLEGLRRDELFRDLIDQMLTRINASADQLQ